ncbi:MAG: hypothetical protein MO853_05270 [Candidatus Protistobacter heckmanni]|nr:hypothetical protein [Candidatus Protistobacter heckmanni]
MKRRTLFGLLAAVAAAQFCASAALAQQDYPSKPIKRIVPFPPGGISETISRAIGSHLQTAFGQTVVVDNRRGGEVPARRLHHCPGRDDQPRRQPLPLQGPELRRAQ